MIGPRYRVLWASLTLVCGTLSATIPLSAQELPPSTSDQVSAQELPTLTSDQVPAQNVSLPSYPLDWNGAVGKMIERYQSPGRREIVEIWLNRSTRYLPMILEIFSERGLPEDLAYTAMVESGFNPLATSRAGARGLWQFMEGTARRYDLAVNRWVDERLDPVKSTVAAARYLADLFDLFGSWYLAQAAYNAGEFKVQYALRRTRAGDFWDLSRSRFLREETRRFVPSVIAAALIAKDPAAYGFNPDYQEPEAIEEVVLTEPTPLHLVANFAGITVGRLRELNPELRGGVTPLGVPAYRLRLPEGLGEPFLENLARRPSDARGSWRVHKVQRGQNLAQIAKLYGASPEAIAEANLLRGPLKPGRELAVPPGPAHSEKGLPRTPEEDGIYVVRQGDTLTRIARAHGVTLVDLIRWNGLRNGQLLHPGQRLRVRNPEPLLTAFHVVQPRETLSGIADRYRLLPGKIARFNGRQVGDTIREGEAIRLRAP